MEIFLFLFLILNGFFKGFQMIYHLFLSSHENILKKVKMSERESACTKIYVRQCISKHFRSREEFCIVAKLCGNNFHFLVEIFTPVWEMKTKKR